MTASRINRRGFLALPGVIFSVFPTLVCPGCWPAYAGLLSALGLPFIPSNVYLLPVTALFLAVAIAAFAYRARERHRYGPFLLGVAASVVVLVSKFVVDVQAAAYTGAGLLIVASLWNSMPRRTALSLSCAHCAPPGSKAPTTSVKEASL